MWVKICRTTRPFRQMNYQLKKKGFLGFPYGARNFTGSPGSGAGRGGGAGGSIKESGGGLGKYGAAQEEGYFYQKTKEQLEKLKKKLKLEQQPKSGPEEEPQK